MKLSEHESRLRDLERRQANQGRTLVKAVGIGNRRVVTRGYADPNLQRQIDELKRSISFLKGESDQTKKDVGSLQRHDRVQDGRMDGYDKVLPTLKAQGEKADKLWEKHQKESAGSTRPANQGTPLWKKILAVLLTVSLIGLLYYLATRNRRR
jgi:hypothetical protein